jgi:hypothetical protein
MIKGWKNNPQWREHFAAVKERRAQKLAKWRLMQWESEQTRANLNAALGIKPGGIIQTPAETPRERFERWCRSRSCAWRELV